MVQVNLIYLNLLSFFDNVDITIGVFILVQRWLAIPYTFNDQDQKFDPWIQFGGECECS